MSSELDAAEVRALEVAAADLRGRVTWSDDFTVRVAAAGDAYEVTFLRTLPAGAPSVRGGGIDAGITYRVTAAGAIDRITYPR